MQANSNSVTAKDYKDQGNKLFTNHCYEEAIGCYTKAIARSPDTSVYFTNRALCFLHLKQWEKVILDCRKALDLEKKSVKAHYYLGRALLCLQQYDEAIKALTRAYEIAVSQKALFGDEITSALRQARRERFRIEEDVRIKQEIELQTYLNKLVNEDKERKLDALLQSSSKNSPDKQETERIEMGAQSRLADIGRLFALIDDRRKRRDVPDYLCGKISFELLRDPVVTPSGVTYDRKDILEHLQRVGHFDPVTRAPLSAEQLIPNLAMKEVVDHFLEQNEWAADY